MPQDVTMKQLRMVTAVCAFSLSIAHVKAEEQFLVNEGNAYAEIIISESPAHSTRLAAAEMQTYVAKISGARLLRPLHEAGTRLTQRGWDPQVPLPRSLRRPERFVLTLPGTGRTQSAFRIVTQSLDQDDAESPQCRSRV